MIGYVAQRPVYFEFDTPEIATSETRTTIYRNGKRAAAYFEWTMGTHMGLATIGGTKIPMSNLVAPGTSSNSRMFHTKDGRTLEWRKVAGFPGAYDLLPGSGAAPIARFSRFPRPRDTPVGPSHAILQCQFDDDELLLEAALALCLNRWIDQHGF